MIGVNVQIHGTYLTGGGLPLVDNFVTEITWQVAAQGLADWHHKLDQRLQHPTGYYESQLMVERQTPEIVWAHDRNMIYGPWLEGTGSRNRTTHFKGYRSVRETTQELGRKVPTVVAPYVEQLIRRLES